MLSLNAISIRSVEKALAAPDVAKWNVVLRKDLLCSRFRRAKPGRAAAKPLRVPIFRS